MFGFIRRLFGQGRVRVEFTYIKGNQLHTGSVKVPYEGEWDEEHCMDYVRNQLIVEHGIYPLTIRIVGHIQY